MGCYYHPPFIDEAIEAQFPLLTVEREPRIAKRAVLTARVLVPTQL